jgi:hypothetical protein
MHGISKFMSVRVTGDPAESSGRRTGAALNITIRVLHRDEIVEVLAYLLDLVAHRDPAGAGLFAQGHCEQMLILTDPGVGLGGAALAAKVTQVVRLSQEVMGQSCNVIEKDIAGAGEWPGIVLTVRGPPYSHAPGLGNAGHRVMQASVSTDGIFVLPIRLHVRTIFDDISAHLHEEILNALAAADDRQASSRRLQILSRAEPHLSTLQQFLNGCATYFHVIRRDLTEMLSGALDKGRAAPSMGLPYQIQMELSQQEMPEPLITEVMEIMKERSRLVPSGGLAPGRLDDNDRSNDE